MTSTHLIRYNAGMTERLFSAQLNNNLLYTASTSTRRNRLGVVEMTTTSANYPTKIADYAFSKKVASDKRKTIFSYVSSGVSYLAMGSSFGYALLHQEPQMQRLTDQFQNGFTAGLIAFLIGSGFMILGAHQANNLRESISRLAIVRNALAPLEK